MSKIPALKSALVDALVDQIENGVPTLTRDGDLVTVPAAASILGVAAKVVKDWADEAAEKASEEEQMTKLSSYLQARRPQLAVNNE